MTKTLRTILIALVVLGVAFVINRLGQKKYTTSRTELFTGRAADVHGIVIEKGAERLELFRQDTTWSIVGHDSLVVKESTLNNFLGRVLTLQRESLVSRKPEKWIKFSVDDSSGTAVQLLDRTGAPLGRYVFGTSRSDFSRNYVRSGDDPQVYQTGQNIIYQLQTRPTYWGEVPPPPEADTTATEE